MKAAKKRFDNKLKSLLPEEKSKLESVERLAASLLYEHNLGHYKFRFGYGWRYKGRCYYNKAIVLELHYVLISEMQEIRNTLLHEIAHALLDPNVGHRLEWQLKAKELGVTWTKAYRK